MADVDGFERMLKHKFQNHRLPKEVLTHSSLLNEHPGLTSNSRLAHVGDAVVGLAVRAALFQQHPKWEKGELTIKAAELVRNKNLADVTQKIGLDKLLTAGGSRPSSIRVRAELFEAAIGAVFFDSDYSTAAKLAAEHLGLADSSRV